MEDENRAALREAHKQAFDLAIKAHMNRYDREWLQDHQSLLLGEMEALVQTTIAALTQWRAEQGGGNRALTADWSDFEDEWVHTQHTITVLILAEAFDLLPTNWIYTIKGIDSDEKRQLVFDYLSYLITYEATGLIFPN